MQQYFWAHKRIHSPSFYAASGAFNKQTRPLVVGSMDKAIFGTADLFIVDGTVTVTDDCGLQVEEADFTNDFYGSL